VTAIGLPAAEQIFYVGFTSLPSTATMAEARATTVAVAGGLYGEGSLQQTSTINAWEAVGVEEVD
jgi:Zn-dependent metalloprotease